MNKNKYALVILSTFIIFYLQGCNGITGNNEKAFSKIVGIPINHYIKITYTGSMPIDTQTMISFDFENKTNDCVRIPIEPDLLYVYDNNNWRKIPNDIEVFGTTIGPAGTPFAYTGDVINPDYSSIPLSAYPIRMRVVIIGSLCHKGVPSDEIIADYIELLVNKP